MTELLIYQGKAALALVAFYIFYRLLLSKETFQHLGQQPTFNGGNANEFSKWVAANLKYPEKCRQSKVQDRVTLQFTITEKCEVTDVKVLRGVNKELDIEALRVVSASPRWIPGKDKKATLFR